MHDETVDFRLKCLELALRTIRKEEPLSFTEKGDIPSIPDELHKRAEAIARYAHLSYPTENHRTYRLK
jgi:hypothetical protein